MGPSNNPLKGSPLRALRWCRPAKRRYPLPTELAIARIAEAVSDPHGDRYRALWDAAPVLGGEKQRQRAKRSDGATNVGTLLQTMIAAADLGNGYVATPVGDRQWRRKSYYDLDGLAYGAQVPGERGFRRTERAAAELVALGFVRSVPWSVVTAAGVRAVAGAKFITEKCWRVLGAWPAVKAERRRRDRERGHAKAAEVQRLARDPARPRRAPKTRASAAVTPQAPAPKAQPPPERGPSPAMTPAAEAAFAAIRSVLGD